MFKKLFGSGSSSSGGAGGGPSISKGADTMGAIQKLDEVRSLLCRFSSGRTSSCALAERSLLWIVKLCRLLKCSKSVHLFFSRR